MRIVITSLLLKFLQKLFITWKIAKIIPLRIVFESLKCIFIFYFQKNIMIKIIGVQIIIRVQKIEIQRMRISQRKSQKIFLSGFEIWLSKYVWIFDIKFQNILSNMYNNVSHKWFILKFWNIKISRNKWIFFLKNLYFLIQVYLFF